MTGLEIIKQYPEREDIIDRFNLYDETCPLFPDPPKEFDNGIIGITEDNHHFVYGFYKTAESLAAYYKEYDKINSGTVLTDEDYLTEGMEWLENNTLPSLSYYSQEFIPIFITELNNI